MITFEIAGIAYENILESNFMESMIEFTNEASFKIALDGNESSPFIVGDDCIVYVDGQKVMTGYIYDADLSYSSGSHDLTYIVRDKTADFSDSDIDNISDLSGSLSLTKIIEQVVLHLGTDISVINDFDGLKNFDLSNDDIRPEFGQSAFDYIDSLARKRQVLIGTNEDGNIAIYRNSQKEINGKILNSISDPENNNILSSKFSYSTSELFNKYVVRSQLGGATSKSPFGSGVSNKEVVNQVGKFVDDKIRVGRQRCVVSEQSSTNEVNEERAKWERDFANVESTSYSVTLQGHSLNDEIFKSNRLIQVTDDFSRLDDKFLIKSVNMIESLSEGTKTSLVLVPKNSFEIIAQAEEEEEEKKEKKSIWG